MARGWGAQGEIKPRKQREGWGAQDKKSKRGRTDRDDRHPDSGGDIWEGTRRFGPFRAR